MQDRPLRAPVDLPSRILEIGCGTGTMTYHLADTYPSAAEVIGVDLSPVPHRATSEGPTFIKGDFKKLARDPKHAELRSNSFDYAFSRMLTFGMTDWGAYILQVKDLLKPGGWIELQDLDLCYWDEDENVISGSWNWLQRQSEACLRIGVDVRVGGKLERYLEEAGFVDIQASRFRWMHGAYWKGHPETDTIAEYAQKHLFSTNATAYRKLLASMDSKAEIDNAIVEMGRTLDWSEDGKHAGYFVVYGRRP